MVMKKIHGDKFNEAYLHVYKFLEKHGFFWQCGVHTGNMYVYNKSANELECVLVVQDLVKRFDWFKYAIIELRMLRMEECTNFMPVIKWMRNAKKTWNLPPERVNREQQVMQ
jgi:virulence-associated protein VapD